jgi:hypothetical protein
MRCQRLWKKGGKWKKKKLRGRPFPKRLRIVLGQDEHGKLRKRL